VSYWSQTNGTIFNKQTQILAYADDINILALEREVNKVGLKINERKTKRENDLRRWTERGFWRPNF
jgi:hypothetical protein